MENSIVPEKKRYEAKWLKFFFYLFLLAVFAVVSLVVLFLLFPYIPDVLFGGDYAISLPSGYSLSQIYGGAVLLADSNQSIIIGPNIDGYKVYEQQQIVIGHVSNKGLLPPDSECSIPGFFILDLKRRIISNAEIEVELRDSLKNHRVIVEGLMIGLDEKNWLDSLKMYGITEKPILHEPSIFDSGSNYSFIHRLRMLVQMMTSKEE